MEMEVASEFPEIQEFDYNDLGSYLRWQYGIYRHLGMSYEEFWEKDYRLVESYIKKHNMDIDRETSWSWEIIQYVRAVAQETAVLVHGDKNDKKKAEDIVPRKPVPRSELGLLNSKRDELISKEVNNKIQEKINKVKNKGESNGDS